MLFIACDHAGFEMKSHLLKAFPKLAFTDLGTYSNASTDYPDYAQKLCDELKPNLPGSFGVLVCGSGQGMAIKANRNPFIRAALCLSEEMAKLSRQHNDANVLCLAGRLTSLPLSEKILTAFLNTPFEGGRHQTRVNKL